MVIFHTWHLQKQSFLFIRVLPLNPWIHEIHSQIAVGVIRTQKFKILKFLNMSLCWKIYHFFHHKFSINSNKPPQMHRSVIRIDIQRKKNCAKKCLYWPPRGCEKMVIFHTWHLQKQSFLFIRVLLLHPGRHEIHSQIAVGVIWTKKFKIQKSLNSKIP